MKRIDESKQPYLAKRLKLALESKQGATQLGLAKACGVKPPSVNGWFTEQTKSISAANAVRAARYLGVTVAWLVLAEEPMYPEIDPEEYRVARALHRLDAKVRDSFVKGIFAALDDKDDPPPSSPRRPRLNT